MNSSQFSKVPKSFKLSLLAIAILAVGLFAVVQTAQKSQETRSRAAGEPSPAASCGSSPTATMLIIDRSGSMNEKLGSAGTGISNAKTEAKIFVDILALDNKNTVGLVSFSTSATVDSPLGNNYSSVKNEIDDLDAEGSTCTECAIDKANKEIAKDPSGNKKAVVLLTDGRANYSIGDSRQQTDPTIPEKKAVDAAKRGFNEKGTVFYTIGLGKDINDDFLKKIATETGGQYFKSPATDQLHAIYEQISLIVGKGSISGFVFDDVNNNAALDSNDAKLSGWTLQLLSQGSTTPRTFTSDATTGFNITGLCNGNYTLKQVVQTGWRQTLPTGPNGYSITVTNGIASPNVANFGNKKGNTCADGIDNNNNGLIDIKDPICHTDGNPNNPDTYDPDIPEISTRCNDKIDNDNNSLTDEKDATCHTDGNADNPNSYDPKRDGERSNTCYDLKDNNGNQLIDKADPVCHTDKNPNNPNSYDPKLPETGNTCADGIDNNNNGLIDIKDPICHTDGNPNNPDSYDPNRPEVSPTPTPTIAVSKTELSLTVLLHGIGASGDNANPTASSLSNKNPKHPTRDVNVFIYNTSNQLISSTSGEIKYASASGDYRGKVFTKTALPTGNYNVRVQTNQHLIRLIPGIQSIVIDKPNQLPNATLVTGDINDDNKLNILDYNLLIDCYSDLSAAPSCADPKKKLAADINDDTPVNQTDYNLFLREISNQPGE